MTCFDSMILGHTYTIATRDITKERPAGTIKIKGTATTLRYTPVSRISTRARVTASARSTTK